MTVKVSLTPVSAPAERVALSVNEPPELKVTECEASIPLEKPVLVPIPVESVPFELISTVPVNPVTVALRESCARTWMKNGVPAV